MTDQGESGAGMHAFSILISGVLLYGGIGWLLDSWLRVSWLLPLGLVAGAVIGIYVIVAKFGRSA